MEPGHDCQKLLLAIDTIIKDSDKKYDECRVEKFLDFLTKTCKSRWIEQVRPILDRLTYYFNHDAFVMLHQPRAFKILFSLIKAKTLSEIEFNEVTPLLNHMWNSCGMIVVNQNLAAMTIVLSICDHLLDTEFGLRWLFDRNIEPKLDLSPGYCHEINNISSLVRYYMETSNNYHTKHMAERLFHRLFIFSINPEPHPQTETLKNTIHELALKGSPSMISTLVEPLKKLSDAPQPLRAMAYEQYGIPEIIEQSLLARLEQPNADLKNICKCMALTSSSENFSNILAKLKSKNHLHGIIYFLSNSRFKRSDQTLLTYLLYPLLTNCPGEDTQVLIKGLMATRDERDFIDRRVTNKLVTLCLGQLSVVINDSSKINHLSSKSLYLIINTLINYIKCQYANRSNYNNVMECSSIISMLFRSCNRLVDIITDTQYMILEILKDIETRYAEDLKPITLQLLNLTRLTFRNVYSIKTDKKAFIPKYIELAFKFTDLDILDEFANLFMSVRHVRPDNYEQFIDLVWNHMYPKAKEECHPELLGRLAHLFIEIDLQADIASLDKYNIKRYHVFPAILGEMLIDYAPVDSTVELVIESLEVTCLRDSSVSEIPSSTSGYLNQLESPTLSKAVRKGADRLISGLCTAVKGECSQCMRELAMKLIGKVTKEIITYSDDHDRIIGRLAKNGILILLYEILNGTMYCEFMYDLANFTRSYIRSCLLINLADSRKILVKHLVPALDHSDKKSNLEDREKKAEMIADFYNLMYLKNGVHENYRTQIDDKIALHSMVDEILNHDLKHDGISDCY